MPLGQSLQEGIGFATEVPCVSFGRQVAPCWHFLLPKPWMGLGSAVPELLVSLH